MTTARLSQLQSISQRTGLSIDRIIKDERDMPATLIQQCLKAQGLIETKRLHADVGIQALKLCREQVISLEQALSQLDWDTRHYQLTCKLGELLLAAGCLNERQLADALEVCVASGLPLAKILVMRQVVSDNVSYAALTAQVLIREQTINLQQAVALIATVAGGASIITALSGHMASKVRLGELLLVSGFITDMQLLIAVEKALTMDSKIGEVLIGEELLDRKDLENALKIQDQINTRKISLPEGIEQLKKSKADNGALLEESSLPMTVLPFYSFQPGAQGRTPELEVLLFELKQQQENMAFRIVNEQEELKQSLAREIHDTIIADLMMLRRYLSGDKELTVAENIQIVDHITNQLRDLCYDFAPPRHLQDVGLMVSIEDLLNRASSRTGVKCTLSCDGALPDIPEPVKLHIFRVVQESLNNTFKYAEASQVNVQVLCDKQGTVAVCVSDNGKGFESSQQADYRRDGGSGLSSLQDRAALIRVYFPAQLTLESVPGKGTIVTLKLQVRQTKL
jgi:signal transduction histidine kinase